LGAVLFARRLDEWRGLKRKAIRVIKYSGVSRSDAAQETVGNRGYASAFDNLLGYVNSLIPANEVIERALRKTVPRFPGLAVHRY
jgi:predicted HTH transcriptional regulator